MRVVATLCLSAMMATDLNAQEAGSRVDSVMRAAEAKGFSGVIRITKGGSLLLEKGYGYADRATRRAFSPQTVVQIGSNTKDFTTVAILQLQERGLLTVDDKLGKFFPEAPADKKDITIRQLMKHRAGFPLGLGGDFEPLTRDQLVSKAMAYTLLFPPGSKQSYSNTGYSLLAAIIEKLSGKTYDIYVRDNILTPLGLRRTGFHLPGFSRNDLAHGYRENGDDAGTMLSKPHAADGPYWNLRGNGGMLSTLSDMSAFYKALFETDKLLKPETRNTMFNPTEPVAFAGSDLVNFFLYERDPQAGVEIMIASTNASMKAPSLRDAIARASGLADARGGRVVTVDDNELPGEGRPVPAEQSALIDAFVAALNQGGRDSLIQFIVTSFVAGPQSPTPAERADRLSGLRDDLGVITVVRKAIAPDGAIHAFVKSVKENQALLIFDIEPSSPPRIRRFGVQIGN